jgi:hypothetical protein
MLSWREIRGYIFDTTCMNYFVLTGHITRREIRYAGRALVSKEVMDELKRGVVKVTGTIGFLQEWCETMTRLSNYLKRLFIARSSEKA